MDGRLCGVVIELKTKPQFQFLLACRRTSENIVELCEISFDLKLTENCLRIRFQDVPIISGVQIYEFKDRVLVLACTVNGVYRFVFPHPDKLHGQVSFQIFRPLHLNIYLNFALSGFLSLLFGNHFPTKFPTNLYFKPIIPCTGI